MAAITKELAKRTTVTLSRDVAGNMFLVQIKVGGVSVLNCRLGARPTSSNVISPIDLSRLKTALPSRYGEVKNAIESCYREILKH